MKMDPTDEWRGFLRREHGIVQKSKAGRSMWNYARSVVATTDFQKWVKYMRKKTGIKPEKGGADKNASNIWNAEIQREIWKKCEEIKLYSADWSDAISYYIVADKLDRMGGNLSPFMTCSLFDQGEKGVEVGRHNHEEFDRLFPLSIRISPYASIQEIQEFVRSYTIPIKELQEKYRDPKTRIGKIRLRPSLKLYDFVYKNRNVRPLSKLAEMVYSEFGRRYSTQHLSTILTRAKKRQQQL